MAQKKRPFLKNFIIYAVLAINIFFAFAFLLSLLANFISPTLSVFVAYCGMAFYYLLFINIGFSVFWIFVNYRFSLISVCVLLLNVNNIDKHYQLKSSEVPPVCENCVKVMTYNCKLFGVYNSDDPKEREKEKNKILDFLLKEQPDIVCFQEYFLDKSGKLKFNTTDTILSILNLDNRPYSDKKEFYYQHFTTNLKKEYYYGLAIFSKFKIVNADFIQMPDSSTNGAIFVDIKYKGDTIRVYPAHLESIHMEKVDYETGNQFINNDLNNPKLNVNAKKIGSKLKKAFRERAMQARTLRANIDSCRFPVIICGDFNDTPASYSYNKISHGFKDTYRESGEGRGDTYFGSSFPSYRIDYILHDKKFNAYGHTICKDVLTSDHYPVFSYISLKKR